MAYNMSAVDGSRLARSSSTTQPEVIHSRYREQLLVNLLQSIDTLFKVKIIRWQFSLADFVQQAIPTQPRSSRDTPSPRQYRSVP